MLLIAKAALGAGAALVLSAAYVFHEGVIRVDVDEKCSNGNHIHVWVPATAVSAGLHLAPRRALCHAAEQARPFLPVLREISKELKKYPNADLLEVRDGSDHVHLTVRNGRLYLDVVNNQDNVHISFPAETLADVADGLEDAAPSI